MSVLSTNKVVSEVDKSLMPLNYDLDDLPRISLGPWPAIFLCRGPDDFLPSLVPSFWRT